MVVALRPDMFVADFGSIQAGPPGDALLGGSTIVAPDGTVISEPDLVPRTGPTTVFGPAPITSGLPLTESAAPAASDCADCGSKAAPLASPSFTDSGVVEFGGPAPIFVAGPEVEARIQASVSQRKIMPFLVLCLLFLFLRGS